MAELAVVIVNWNTAAYLERCLNAVYAAQGGLDLEVWVVDNASQDGSVALVRSRFPQVQLIANPENVGFARANNQALRALRAEFALLLNSDAFLQAGSLERMLAAMRAHPECGGLGCRLLNPDGSLQRSCYAFPTLATEVWQTLWLDRLFPRSPVFGKFLMTDWAMDEAREVDVVMGACLLLRRQALEQVGLLDEDYFMYSEEVDLCYRLAQAGWKVRYAPEAEAVHIWGGSSGLVKVESLLRLYRSRVQFFRKHYGAGTAAAYKGLLYLNSLSRAVSGRLAYVFSQKEALLQKTQGYWRLFQIVGGF